MLYHLLASLLFLTTWTAYADNIFPDGCTPLVVHEDTIKLTTEKPTLVFILNISKMDLWMTHPMSEPNTSTGWSSRLQAGNWSALALDNKAYELTCIESRPGHEQQVPCAGVIAACQWPNVTMPQSKESTYWAGEDKSLGVLTAHIGSNGFVIPAPANK